MIDDAALVEPGAVRLGPGPVDLRRRRCRRRPPPAACRRGSPGSRRAARPSSRAPGRRPVNVRAGTAAARCGSPRGSRRACASRSCAFCAAVRRSIKARGSPMGRAYAARRSTASSASPATSPQNAPPIPTAVIARSGDHEGGDRRLARLGRAHRGVQRGAERAEEGQPGDRLDDQGRHGGREGRRERRAHAEGDVGRSTADRRDPAARRVRLGVGPGTIAAVIAARLTASAAERRRRDAREAGRAEHRAQLGLVAVGPQDGDAGQVLGGHRHEEQRDRQRHQRAGREVRRREDERRREVGAEVHGPVDQDGRDHRHERAGHRHAAGEAVEQRPHDDERHRDLRQRHDGLHRGDADRQQDARQHRAGQCGRDRRDQPRERPDQGRRREQRPR